jgi:hypothetical protein
MNLWVVSEYIPLQGSEGVNASLPAFSLTDSRACIHILTVTSMRTLD